MENIPPGWSPRRVQEILKKKGKHITIEEAASVLLFLESMASTTLNIDDFSEKISPFAMRQYD